MGCWAACGPRGLMFHLIPPRGFCMCKDTGSCPVQSALSSPGLSLTPSNLAGAGAGQGVRKQRATLAEALGS